MEHHQDTGTEATADLADDTIAPIVLSIPALPEYVALSRSTIAALATRFACPVLALYGGADEGIPPEAVAAFDRALDAAGIERETVVYPGASHSFFDRNQEQFADASADAWRRVLAFVAAHA